MESGDLWEIPPATLLATSPPLARNKKTPVYGLHERISLSMLDELLVLIAFYFANENLLLSPDEIVLFSISEKQWL